MSCAQITGYKLACPSYTFTKKVSRANGASCTAVSLGRKLPNISLKLMTTKSGCRQFGPVCLFGGKDKSENGNEASPWKAIEKSTGFFKQNTSIEDVLKQQIEKREFYGGGSGGEEVPPGGGGGNGFGSFGGASDESPLEDIGHKMLAILAFLFLYANGGKIIPNSEIITVLAKDTLKFLFTGQQSHHLRKTLSKMKTVLAKDTLKWKNFVDSMKQKEEYFDPLWLEHAIINTPTLYDSPAKYRKIMKISPNDDSSPKKVDSSPREYLDASHPEYDDPFPPGYFDVSPPDDDAGQYIW